MTLSALIRAQPAGPAEEEAQNFMLRAWEAMGLWGRIGFILTLAALVIYLIVLGLRRLGRGGRRSLLWGVTGLCLVGVLVLGVWSYTLPAPGGGYFVLWHQLVRVGAAVCGTFFVICVMALGLPFTLDRLEGRGFIPYVAARHVRAGKSGFLTVISFLSIAGVAVSSFALCAVVSIMGGFGADLKRKILGNNAHVKIEATSSDGFDNWRDTLETARLTPGVRAATPVVAGEAMASSASNTAGLLVRGIDPNTIGQVIDLEKNIEVGDFAYLTDTKTLANLPAETVIYKAPDGTKYYKGPDIKRFRSKSKLDPEVADAIVEDDQYPGVVVGRELAKTLHVYVGDEISLVSPLGDLGPMGVLPRTRKFRVAAVFYSGMYEYDASHAYMLMDEAQSFLDRDAKISGIEVKAEKAEDAEQVAARLKAEIGRKDIRVRDWKELNRNLFSALKLEKIATFIILSIAIAVASFCIICTLLLMVTEKSKEIAIMKAIGANDGAILRIFMSEGVIIGAIGTVFGVATGLAMMLGLEQFGVRLDPEVYYVDKLPVEVDWLDYTMVALASMIITTLATIYPAVAASRLTPVDGIRYE